MNTIEQMDNFLASEFERMRTEKEAEGSKQLVAAGWRKTIDTPFASYWLPPGETDEGKAMAYNYALFSINS